MTSPVLHAARLLVPALLVAGCSAAGNGQPPPVQRADSPVYRCPDGRRFTQQFDTTTHQTDLFLDGTARRLDPVPDPLGGVVYQDADYQLRPTRADQVFALTDRSTTTRQDCTRQDRPPT